MAPRNKRSRRKLLAFAPALVVVAATAITASGASLVSGATAASTVGVNGTVELIFSADPTVGADCAGETLGTGPGANFATNPVVSNGCTVSFSTNNALGAEVVFENNALSDTNFFCSDPDGAGTKARTCATDAAVVDDVVGKGNAIAASSDKFGLALMAVGGGGDVATTSGGTGVSAADPTPLPADLVWAEIPDDASPAAQLCSLGEPNATTSTCQFAFAGAGSGATQGAGAYTGTLRLTTQLL